MGKKKRTFRKFTFRGVDLDQLLDMSMDQLLEMMSSRVRRRFRRGLKRKHMALLKKLRSAKKEATDNEKPAVVKTHLRNMVIVPEMVGSIVGVYNGKVFNSVEVKPETDWTSFGRIQHLLQACQTRKARYWCHSQLPFYPIEVNLYL